MFYARLRHYPSAFEAAVDGVNVSPSVCDSLIDSVHRNMDKMHRYVSLRKKLLGVDQLHMYDVYTPMVPGLKWETTFEEAKETALKALAPLGSDYTDLLKEAFENRWIDVVENKGKRGGAYSTDGIYGVHPYVLLNFNGTLDDIFTLVHEMGHSLHTWYSCHDQTFLNSRYKIFVAEVASTTNEVLLLEYLLKETKDKDRLKYLVNHYLESFKGTLYRQTMFAEFEKLTHEYIESGGSLTPEWLNTEYGRLNSEYYGPEVTYDDKIKYEWSRIPHFYRAFYVYQYATGYSAANAIAERILTEGPSARDEYISFLRSGSSGTPIDLLKLAGVDMSTEKPVRMALEVFDGLVDRLDELTKGNRNA